MKIVLLTLLISGTSIAALAAPKELTNTELQQTAGGLVVHPVGPTPIGGPVPVRPPISVPPFMPAPPHPTNPWHGHF